ncbi:FtsK/SpoIIIE domain-containing protein [Calidifontibacter indicus]|uniref:FtsK/SpoIIIE domain-containing protein n=1 Tax=Calidifontibacter indicus TaxID=419650 RepID=UPI003D721D34
MTVEPHPSPHPSPRSPARTQIAVTLVGTLDGRERRVRISAPSGLRWAAAREAVEAAGHPVPDPAWIGAGRLDDDTRLGDIANGAVIAPDASAGSASDLLRLECTNGPAVGRGHRLGQRAVTVGRSDRASLRLDDPDASRVHCRVDLVAGRVTVTDLGSTNGTHVDGVAAGEGTELRAGGELRVGNSTLALAAPSGKPPKVENGWIGVRRTPTRTTAPPTVRLTAPNPPRERERRVLPWLVVLAPLVIGVGLAWWMRTMMFLAFALFSPVLMLAQHVADKREGKTSRRRELADHAAAVDRHEARVAAVLASERHLRERAAPPLIDAVRSIRAVDARLWHRHPDDHGFLHWRLGRGTIASELTVTDSDGEHTRPELADAPVVVDLGADRLVGVIARQELQTALLSSLLLQVGAWHSPRHLRLAIISKSVLPNAADLSWLPHLGADGPQPTLFDLEHPDPLVDFLRSQMHDRDEGDRPPSLLVVLLDGKFTSVAAELSEIVMNPRRYSATVVTFAHADSHVPDRAHPMLRATSTTRLVVHCAQPTQCVPDLPEPDLLPDLARRLAPLRDALSTGGGGTPPPAIGLAEAWSAATGAPLLDLDATERRWSQEARPNPRAVLGSSAAGPVTVDLTVDGPHALIAGTTGAGKSELLQTLITSLAAVNRPDALNFVLIDYKGGAAFRECARLPHTVGLVTDLDGHLTQRALSSLGAEIHRRERLLVDAGASDLDDYHRDPTRPTIPRLVLVIDEFRVLAEELPDFVDGLVRLATVGRSLGVHLVLATQRPAGVVSADIRANVNLRIALRVRDDGDSQDVIETSEAARLSAAVPGRAYLRCGGGEPMLFQSARVTVPPLRPDAVLVSTPHDALGLEAEPGASTLERFVEVAAEVATRLSMQPSQAPWLPPLPDTVSLADLGEPSITVTGETGSGYRFALADRPLRQDRPALAWSPQTDQHLAIVGGPRGGRTTAVRALLAAALDDDRVHAYVLDLGRSLTDLADHPAVGAVVGPDEPSRVERVLDRLAEAVAARRRSPDATRPRILLVIDGWDVLDELADDTAMFRLLDLATSVLRDGPAADVHVVATGGRGLLTSRSLPMFRSQIALSMPDRDDLAAMGVPRQAIPVRMPAGRAVTAPGGMELQIVLPGALPDREPCAPVDRIAAVPLVVRGVAARPDLIAIGASAEGPAGIALGRRGEALGLIAGPPRSGRTSALLAIAAALAERPVCWVSPDASVRLPSGLFRAGSTAETAAWLAANPAGVVLVDDASGLLDTDLEDLLVDFAARASTSGAVVFAAGDPGDLAATYRGLVGELRRRGTGLLLTPNRTDGELFGVRCPKLDRPRPGNGYLVQRGELTEVQVALVDDPVRPDEPDQRVA